eukprot:169685-Chlamydomonas_euryale.AAC.1
MPLRRLVVAALHCCPDGSPKGRNTSCTNSWWRRARAAVWLAVRHSSKEAERLRPRPLPLQAADALADHRAVALGAQLRGQATML